jgi:predicted DNA binding protein
MDDIARRASSGWLVCDADWTVREATPAVTRLLGDATEVAAADVVGQPLEAVLPVDITDRLTVRVAEAAAGDPVTVEEYLPAAQRWIECRAVRDEDAILVELRDVTEWAQRVNELETARTNLSLLSQHAELISELLGAVVTATTPEEIQRAVAQRLADSDLFNLAWVGDWAADREGLSVRAAAGSEALLAAIRDSDGLGPEQRALETGETAIVRELAEDEGVPVAVRKAAFAHGIQASVAVPLSYGETNFGVLGLYTARPATLEGSGLAGIETLGEVIGFVLYATRQRGATETATYRELVLDVGPDAGPLARLAQATETTLELTGTATVGTELLLAYVALDGGDAESVCERARADDAIERASVIENPEDGDLCELRLGGDSLLRRLADLGGTVRAARFGPDGGTVTVDISPDTDVRGLLDRLTDAVPDVRLQATRTRERPARTTAAVEQVLAEELTERQRASLKAAYEAGYFASPRQSTAAEIADSMDVTAPTFSYHLRAAQAKLLAACFD